MTMPGADTLVLGYGNPGRLDDGLGPGVATAVGSLDLPRVEVDSAYQLNMEDAAIVARYETVVLVDASLDGPEPWGMVRLLPRAVQTFSSHAMPPETILALARDALGWKGRAYLLGVRGYDFDEYAERLSKGARANLGAAVAMLSEALVDGDLDGRATGPPINDSVAFRHGGEQCTTANT
jgi:hydrogenase maturation protease